MSKKIIVPTDFSENAFNAAKYACHLAINQEYSIYLLHCYNSETTIFDEKINEKEPITPLLRGDLIMQEWKDSLSKEFPDLFIETECREGLVTEVLPKIAVDPFFSFVTMGSNGSQKKNSPMFGSTTSQVATASHIPVVAVPNNLQSDKINKAAILTNFKEDELESLKQFIERLGATDELDVVHVYQNSDDLAEIKTKINQWAQKIQSISPKTKIHTVLKPINYSNDKLDTIGEVVNNTINEKQYDIVIVTKTRKSFFDRWFSRSISKEVILELETVVFFDNN